MNTKSFLNTLEPGKTEEQSAKANIVRGNALLGTVCTLRNHLEEKQTHSA